MLSGRVDATLGAYWNYEAIQLQQMGKHPNVIRMNRVGVPNYNELVVVVRQSTLAQAAGQDPPLPPGARPRIPVGAANPTAAVDNLVRANPSLDRKLQLASVRATLPAFFPSGSSNPWGYQDQVQWNSYGQWMLHEHLITNPAAVANASTNEELAGEGL